MAGKLAEKDFARIMAAKPDFAGILVESSVNSLTLAPKFSKSPDFPPSCSPNLLTGLWPCCKFADRSFQVIGITARAKPERRRELDTEVVVCGGGLVQLDVRSIFARTVGSIEVEQWIAHKPAVGSSVGLFKGNTRTFVAVQEFLCELARFDNAAVSASVTRLVQARLGQRERLRREQRYRVCLGHDASNPWSRVPELYRQFWPVAMESRVGDGHICVSTPISNYWKLEFPVIRYASKNPLPRVYFPYFLHHLDIPSSLMMQRL
jgi:hypothetical protein